MEETEQTPVEAQANEPSAETSASDESTQGSKRGGLGRLIGWLLLLAILAVAVWFGWRYWQQRQAAQQGVGDGAPPATVTTPNATPNTTPDTQSAPSASLPLGEAGEQTTSSEQPAALVEDTTVRAGGAREARLKLLESQVERLRGQLHSLRQQGTDDKRTEQVVRNQLLGLEERMGEVEDAVASMARQRLSARDSMLIGDAEMLLMLGAQRYRLFDDAAAAIAAFGLADNSLAAIDSPRFAAVRQAIASERKALAASQPAARASWLEDLGKLRLAWQQLPLAQAPDKQPANTDKGAWQRTLDTLSGLVKVRRTSGDPGSLAMADATLARQLGALELASAQAALLAGDASASRAALERAGATMAHAFHMTDPAVRALADKLTALRQSIPAAAAKVELGAALDKLRDLRAVGAINRHAPAAPENAPARPTPAAATSTQPAPATTGSAA